MLRRSPLFATVLLATAACTASGSNDQAHGPLYDLDAASSGADARADATAPGDASVTDAPSGADASVLDSSSSVPDSSTSDATSNDAGDAASCTGATAILGGSTPSLFGAWAVGHGALAGQSIAGSLTSAPGVVAFGAGFQALVRASGDAVDALSFASPSWSGSAALPGNPLALAAPALAAVGAQVHAVYLGTNNRYYHATFNGTAWDSGSDPVSALADGGSQAFGPARASAAGLAAELVVAYQGNDGHLYAQSWTAAGKWSAAVEIGTVSLATGVAPALVALVGGTHDLLVAYEDAADTKIYSFARDASTKAWSVGPTVVDATAFTHEAPSLAASAGGAGRAVVAWRGTDGLGYSSAYDPATPAWSTPHALVAGTNPPITAAPALASGTCGDDVAAAYVSGGAVAVARFASGAWSVPAAVTGVTGASFVAIATSP